MTYWSRRVTDSAEIKSEGTEGDVSQEMSLLIFASNQNSVRNAVQFVNRRGVRTVFTDNLHEAVDVIASGQVQSVLMSVNISHPKIEAIPNLFQQNYGVGVIVFAEQHDRRTSQLMSATKCRHSIFGVPSGPTVMMRLRAIQKEKAQAEAESTNPARMAAGMTGDLGNSNIKVSGSGRQGDMVSIGPDRNDSDNKVKFFEGLATAGGSQIMSGQGRMGEGGTGSGSHQAMSGSAMTGSGASQSNMGSIGTTGLPGPAGAASSPSNQRAMMSQALSRSDNDTGMADQKSAYMSQQTPFEQTPQQSNPKAGHAAERPAPTNSSMGTAVGQPMPTGEARARTTTILTNLNEGQKRKIFNQSAERAMDDTTGVAAQARRSGRRPIQTDIHLRELVVVNCRGKTLNGTIAIAIGDNKTGTTYTAEFLRDKLLYYLGEYGLAIDIEDVQTIPLCPLDFKCRYLAAADVVVSSLNPALEVVLSFLSGEDVGFSLDRKVGAMYEVPLKTFEQRYLVPTPVYLHLPGPNRFLKYLQPGTRISLGQLVRFQNENVGALFVHENEALAFRPYGVKSRLSEILAMLEKRQKLT